MRLAINTALLPSKAKEFDMTALMNGSSLTKMRAGIDKSRKILESGKLDSLVEEVLAVPRAGKPTPL